MARSYKQVIVVRTDLKMSTGKKCVQACHAAVAAAGLAKKSHPQEWQAWYREGQKKIALKVRGEAEITKLHARVSRARLPCFLVADAGLTQLEPGTITALGIGPAKEAEIDRYCKDLKLL